MYKNKPLLLNRARTFALLLLAFHTLPAAAYSLRPILLIPGITWHSPRWYTAKELAHIHDINPGMGVAFALKQKYQAQLFYGIDFLDSYANPQPAVGYAYLRSIAGPLSLGLTAGLTHRVELFKRDLIPYVLPITQARIGRLRLYATYIPPLIYDHIKFGDVAFVFLGYAF